MNTPAPYSSAELAMRALFKRQLRMERGPAIGRKRRRCRARGRARHP
jgi:hypothetical protein